MHPRMKFIPDKFLRVLAYAIWAGVIYGILKWAVG